MSHPIIFLHIPKTAGTSFRISAADYFGEENVLFDYGEKSRATSEELKESAESEQYTENVRAAGLRAKMIGGHFSFRKYMDVFPDSPVVSFFRDPVDRVVSEYVHFCNHYEYSGTLEEFYRSEMFQNRQHKILGGAKPTDLHFFGLTEQYQHSLEMFNHLFDTQLHVRRLNTGDYGIAKSKVEATAEQIEEIKQLNQADIALYELAVKHFARQAPIKRSKPRLITRYKGNLGGVKKDHLFGWVFDSESARPIELHVFVNGEKRLSLVADVDRPDIVRCGLRENGQCGFRVPISELGSLQDKDNISIRTADGNFELINSPLILNAA